MPVSRAPWWLYAIAASFLGFFILENYTSIWGPVWIGFRSDYSNGSMRLREVAPEGVAARAGLETGDRIVAIDGMPMRGEKDYYRVSANFESKRPVRIDVERQGKPLEFEVSLRQGSLRDLGFLDLESAVAAGFTFVLALVIGIRRPRDPVTRISAWLMAAIAFDMATADYGEAAVWRKLPFALGLLLWPGWISHGLLSGLSITFGATFPRKLLHNRWVWTLILLPTVIVAVLYTLVYVRLVYKWNFDGLDWVNP